MQEQTSYAALTVIIAALWAVCLSAPATAGPQDVSALLAEKTRAFSDAGRSGDAAVLKAMLDDRVVFFNEAGESSTKDEPSTRAPPGRWVG